MLVGGSGFFGKSILDYFQRRGLKKWDIETITVVARNAKQLKTNAPQLLDARVKLINADICSVNSLPKADLVIHAAASTDVRNYLTQPEKEIQNIQAGVTNFCQLAPTYLKGSKILYVSSGAAYGVQPPTMKFLEEDWIDLSLDVMPDQKRGYAIAKREAEHQFKKLSELSISTSIARCFAFVGPWLPRDQHFAIGNFIEDALHGGPIRINATHPVFRSYMHADDLVRWLMTMVSNADKICETYNVGSDEEIEIGKLAGFVAREFGVEVSRPMLTNENTDRYIPSIEKAKKYLNLDIKISLQESVNTTIREIKKQSAH